MKNKMILSISVFLVFALQSCVYSDYIFREHAAWVTEWLEAPVCSAPCWEGIIPGETTLYQISEVTVKSENLVFDGPIPNSDGSFSFSWGSIENGQVYPAVQATTESKMNMTIGDLMFVFGLPGSYLLVNEIVTSFGEPDSVGIYEEMAGCRAVIFYSDKRVWLTLEKKKMDDHYIINKGTGLGWSYYLSENKRDELLMEIFPYGKWRIQPWVGYGEYMCKFVN